PRPCWTGLRTGRTSWSSTGSRTDSARRSGGVSSWLADVRIVTPCPRGGRGPVTRVVLGVGPVLVSTVVTFWVDIHNRDRRRKRPLGRLDLGSSPSSWNQGA